MHAEAEGLNGPPASDEGKIVTVDAARENRGYQDGDTKACEQCGAPVAIVSPHIGAWVRIADELGHVFYQPVFCSETCWATWATATEKPVQANK